MKNGGILGLIYISIFYLLSSFGEVGFSLNKYSIFTVVFYILLGMIGGIVGVNFSAKKV